MSFWTWLAGLFRPVTGAAVSAPPEAAPDPDERAALLAKLATPAAAIPRLESVSDADIEVAARTLWGEARGESRPGQVAVAWVIRNRVERARRGLRRAQFGGGTVAGACRQPWQFSCWNEGDPNRVRMMTLPAGGAELAPLAAIVRAVMAGVEPDPTGGADHYCTRAIAPKTAWAAGRTPVAAIDAHLFYRLT